MITLRTPIALAASVVALAFATTSYAQDVPAQPYQAATPAPTPAPPPTQPVQPTPTVVVQQPTEPVVGSPVQPIAQPATTSTTTTTAAPYLGGPTTDRYTERTIEHRPNKALLGTGTTLFVLTYGASVIAGAVSDRSEDNKLFIPVVGPWMDLSDRKCPGTCGGGEDVAKAMIVTSGIAQGAGILLALSSLIIPETTSIQERTTTAKAEKPKVQFAPMSYAAGAGVGAVGRF